MPSPMHKSLATPLPTPRIPSLNHPIPSQIHQTLLEIHLPMGHLAMDSQVTQVLVNRAQDLRAQGLRAQDLRVREHLE
jgi:hypothetical protein